MATAEETVQIGIGAMDKLNEQTNTKKRVKSNVCKDPSSTTLPQ